MKLFDILSAVNPGITPEESKLHLAGWNGSEDPLDLYLAGQFNDWQCWQGKRNFERLYVVSLIRMGGAHWLFAGVYQINGYRQLAEPARHDPETENLSPKGRLLHPGNQGANYEYDLVEDPRWSSLNGRLIVYYEREGRQSYRNAESCASGITVHEIRPSRLSVRRFPGFKSILLTKGQLETIFREQHESWRTALSSVAGVYLITDRQTGQLYVGSATGEGGLWVRWGAYAANGHGGNAELRKLLSAEGPGRAGSFQYSVLEIADTHASVDDVLQRESHWKNVLLTREHGLNAN